eukprot:2078746-Lingulodinium_polyedra.AAC.1
MLQHNALKELAAIKQHCTGRLAMAHHCSFSAHALSPHRGLRGPGSAAGKVGPVVLELPVAEDASPASCPQA